MQSSSSIQIKVLLELRQQIQRTLLPIYAEELQVLP